MGFYKNLQIEQSEARLSDVDRMVHSWARFADLVRTDRRFTFFANAPDADGELLDPAATLEAIARAVANAPHRTTWVAPAGTKVFRARAHGRHEAPTSSAELGSAPARYAAANRMSPAGIPMFYGADARTVATAEVRPSEWATTAQWALSRESRLLDLTSVRPVPGLFDPIGRAYRPWLRFLAEFADDVSRPLDPDEGEAGYAPTQVFTEFVRHEMRASTGEPFDGIVYRSALESNERCWVLFATEADCGVEGDGRLLGLDPSSIRRGPATPASG